MWKLIFTDRETLASVASGIQSLVVAISIVVGGWWTMHTFGKLWAAEIATVNAKEAADREDALELTIRAEFLTTYTRTLNKRSVEVLLPRKVIIACLDVVNVGLRTQKIPLDAPWPMTIEHLYQWDGKAFVYTEPGWSFGTLPKGSAIVIAPKTKSTKCFDHPISTPGLYSIRFMVPAGSIGNSLRSSKDGVIAGTAVYQAYTFLNVPP